MTYIKICGITNKDDAILAYQLGADAIGLNFVPSSPRYIDPAIARNIIKNSEISPHWVGVFVNESVERILSVVEGVQLSSVQLHGDENPEFAALIRNKTGLKVIKAFRVSKDFDVAAIEDFEVDAILLDSFSSAAHGGTGEKFDWETARAFARSHDRMYLAGGINPENIREAINLVRPFAVDICSGVENTKGKKDPEKMKDLFEAINKE